MRTAGKGDEPGLEATDPEGTDPDATGSEGVGRLASLDALRGFDMVWIIGGDTLVHLLAGLTGWATLQALSGQLQHAKWAGLHAYDLIFPLFMFLSGVSLSLSLAKHPHDMPEDRRALLNKAGRRTLILLLLGIIYNFGWEISLERFRLASVLGQIGVSYFLAALICIYLRSWSGRVIAVAGIMLVTACLQLFVPVPGGGAGLLTPEGSMNAWIDQTFLPGRLYGGSYDPEGILNTFSASAVTLLGAVIGSFLVPARPENTIRHIVLAGAVLLAAGAALSTGYPIIKSAWTVPFSLVSAGISALLLALFFWLFDGLELMKSGFFLRVIGMNSIGIYMVARFLVYPPFIVAVRMAESQPVTAIALVVAIMIAEWLVLYYCFRRGWFLKV